MGVLIKVVRILVYKKKFRQSGSILISTVVLVFLLTLLGLSLQTFLRNQIRTQYGLAGDMDGHFNYPVDDAFPSTLIEATACERIGISSRQPSYQGTFIEEFYTLVENKNPQALAEAMIKVVNTPLSTHRAKGKEARRVIEAEYTNQLVRERLEAAYQTVAQSTVGARS